MSSLSLLNPFRKNAILVNPNHVNNHRVNIPMPEEIEMRSFAAGDQPSQQSNSIVPRTTSTTINRFASTQPAPVTSSNKPKVIRIRIPETTPPKNTTLIKFEGSRSVFLMLEQIKNFWSSVPEEINGEVCVIETSEGKYIGPLCNGRASGEGTLVVPLGKYKGNFDKGMPNGEGVLTTYINSINGTFLKGLPHGKCGGSYLDINLCINSVKNGMLDTEEIKDLPKPHSFDWKYENGVINGKGEYKYKVDLNKPYSKVFEIYKGDFKDGERHGQGSYLYANKAEYSGQFVNGKRQGKGIYKYADGSKYEGLWDDDTRHGRAILHTKERIIDGLWENDELTFTYSSRSTIPIPDPDVRTTYTRNDLWMPFV